MATNRNEMNVLKITLENPITFKVVDNLVVQILNNTQATHLQIDYGAHDFESIDTLKYCKAELMKIEDHLQQFVKIATISIPPYVSESKDPEKLRHFHTEEEAILWLQKM